MKRKKNEQGVKKSLKIFNFEDFIEGPVNRKQPLTKSFNDTVEDAALDVYSLCEYLGNEPVQQAEFTAGTYTVQIAPGSRAYDIIRTGKEGETLTLTVKLLKPLVENSVSLEYAVNMDTVADVNSLSYGVKLFNELVDGTEPAVQRILPELRNIKEVFSARKEELSSNKYK